VTAFRNPAEARLAARIVALLREGPLDQQAIKARLGLPPRARTVNAALRALAAAGIVADGRLLRELGPKELAAARPEYEILSDELEAGAGLQVRVIRFLENGEVRVQIRLVRRFPGGGLRAQHVLGVPPDVARSLAAALLEAAE
jgi:hypothetical protein